MGRVDLLFGRGEMPSRGAVVGAEQWMSRNFFWQGGRHSTLPLLIFSKINKFVNFTLFFYFF